MGFLGIKDQTFLVVGFANKKSVAWAVAKTLESEGAKVIYSVRTEKRKEELSKLIDEQKILVCDFEYPEQIKKFSSELTHYLDGKTLGGVLHSIAFANYSEGLKPFYQTSRKDFLQAMLVSSFSLVELSNMLVETSKNVGRTFKKMVERLKLLVERSKITCRTCAPHL